jgi:pilus assembly protein CpaB
VYAATSRSGEEGSSAGGVPVVVAIESIAPGTRITAAMLTVQNVPEYALGDQSLTSVEVAIGNIARYPIAANEQVLLSKIVGSSVTASNDVLINILEGGKRAMAIRTNLVVSAGGLLLPGDHVDILWVPGDAEIEHEGALLLAENIEVLAVQQTLVEIAATAPGVQEEGVDQGAVQTAAGDRVRIEDAEPIPDADTVTLLVTLQQASRIFCAEERGNIRFAVRAFGDASPTGLPPAICVIPGQE